MTDLYYFSAHEVPGTESSIIVYIQEMDIDPLPTNQHPL